VKRRTGWGLAVLATALLLGSAAWWVAHSVFQEVSPGQTIRYLERRLLGHPKLEAVALPVLARWRAEVERPAPADVRDLRPAPPASTGPAGATGRTLPVSSVQDLARALNQVQPGETIALAAGVYRIGNTLYPRQAGRADAPITLRAAPGADVTLESVTTEAFKLAQPHWHIEHLTWRGACRSEHDCEHALHVVGAAVGTVIRHNAFLDFNSAIKVNGERGAFPDDGLIAHNRLVNRGPRRIERPLTPIDIVAASRWVVSDNLIANFVKNGSNGVSYGAFMKGGGRDGRIERNLVVCTLGNVSQPGQRVGLSMGGGLTGESVCREQPCLVEHYNGVIANNIVAHCNDVGIDVNRSTGAQIQHNTLINTAGISPRGEPSNAQVRANLLDGRVRARPPATVEAQDNLATDLRSIFEDADGLNLRWRRQPSPVPTANEARDFCGRQRGPQSPPGALTDGPC